jgi:O-antigen ligase
MNMELQGQPYRLPEYQNSANEGGLSPMSLILGVFLIGAASVSNLTGFSVLVKGLGIYLAITYLFRIVRYRVRIPGEVWFYFAWTLWASTGIVVALVPSHALNVLGTVLQICLMIVIIAGLTNNRKALSFNMAMFLIAAVIVGGYSYATGEFDRAAASGLARTGVLADQTRVAGLALNANGFATLMLMATVALAYFWMMPPRALNATLRKVILLLAMFACAIAVLLSGSRKGLVGLALLHLFWIWFCYRRVLFRRVSVLLTVVGIFTIGSVLLTILGMNTRMGERMLESWTGYEDTGIAGGLGRTRADLYQDAFRMISEQPLVGVGLGHFVVHSRSHHAAHSEYAEIIATTGFIGAFIYFGWYVVLWRRTGKIRKYSTDLNDRNIAGLVRAVLLLILILNFTMWIFSQKVPWIILASFIGYTHIAWQRTVENQSLAAEQTDLP